MKRFDTALLAAGIVALVLLAYGRHALEAAAPSSWFSSYDTGPNGYAALYAVLKTAGAPVRRFGRPLALLDPTVRTIVISRYAGEPHAKGLMKDDAARLRRFVERGGRLVALDSEFAGPDDAVPGVGTSNPVVATQAVALADTSLTAGVTRVRGPIPAAFGFRQPRGALPLLAAGGGIVAARYRVGRGEVVAITAPALFGNAQLRAADNLAFAYDTIAGHGPAIFDEYVHGYADGLTLWQSLPQPVRFAFWIACAIVAIATLGAAVPFAPPLRPPIDDHRNSSGYVDAMAALLRRAGAGQFVVSTFVINAQRRFSARPGGPDGAVILEELAALEAIRRPGDAAVLRASRLEYALRKESL